MKKNRFLRVLLAVLLLAAVIPVAGCLAGRDAELHPTAAETQNTTGLQRILNAAENLFAGEPGEIKKLRAAEVPQTDEGRQEYYFKLLNEEQQRAYRQMLAGIRAREEDFYITISEDEEVDKTYHALLKDHPELFWVHNRAQVYKTTFANRDYCKFSPGYTYTEEEMKEIEASMEQGYQDMLTYIPDGADDYEKVKAAYSYLIDTADYEASEHDQSAAGIFWKKKAVCAGYAGALQYLLERLEIPCIYVEGSAKGSTEGHAWNIVQLDGEYYYVDATNGDQPAFLEGDAVQLAEHKTIIYDYLCPFPGEYEVNYTPSDEFPVPECTSTAKNFYVLNEACFDTYDRESIYAFCRMRLDNGAAVVRFKFSSQEAFDAAYSDWIDNGEIQEAAKYYMELYGLGRVEYHYGVLDNMKTMYYMF